MSHALTPHAERHALVGAQVVVDGAVLDEHAVVVEEGRVLGVTLASVVAESVPRHVLAGTLAPGFVDIHAHGAAGAGFNDGTAEAVRAALRSYASAGTTTVLPTLASAPVSDLARAAEVSTRQTGADLARAPGAHLEGPFFSHAQAGAQDPAALILPTAETLAPILEVSEAVRMMSFAPELEGAVWLTESLVARGIVAAAGHSDGTEADLTRCVDAGLTHVIHVYSGQSTVRREGAWRVPGMLEATLASDGLTVEMIADGKHLPATLMRIVRRCVAERLCIVSDSTAGTGLPRGSRFRMGDMEYVVDDGVGMTLDRKAFGGSTTFLSAMLPTVVEAVGMSLPDAISAMTAVPAKAAGLTDVGRIAPGYHADLVLLDAALNVSATALGGHWLPTGS